MKCKFIIFVCLLGLLAYNGHAQTKSLTSFDDSDSVSTETLNENDTILKWKKSRDFSYMLYLDSALRHQKQIKSDTVNMDEKSGKVTSVRKSGGITGINHLLNSLPVKIFFWTLAIIFILIISYAVLVKNGIFLFKKSTITNAADTDIHEELKEIGEYDLLISEAEKNNRWNEASRFLFLQTLKNLADRGLVTFSIEKTNRDYVSEMSSHAYHDEFEKLTHAFEYTWYGKHLISENLYRSLKESFLIFNQKIPIS